MRGGPTAAIAPIPGPLIIGGLGGSGTRVVAKLAIDLGFDMGFDLNEELDGRWFNLLFYRPDWLPTWFGKSGDEVATGLALMRKRAHGEHLLSAGETRFVAHAWRDVARRRDFGPHPAAWASRRVWRFLRSPSPRADERGWGWKEPISHLIAPELLARSPEVRYIHVMRHGLDMAFSSNRRQLKRFGSLLGVDVPEGRSALPQDALRWWVVANRRISEGIATTTPERTYILKFDDLCSAPKSEIDRLIDFLGIDVGTTQRQAMAEIPVTPKSTGRYRTEDLTDFDRDDVEAVAEFGFTV